MTTANDNVPNSAPRSDGGPRYVHRNRTVHIPDGHLAIGLIVGVHGLRGEIKVELHTDFPERYAAGEIILVGSDLRPMNITRARPHKSFMLVTFQGITGRNQAEALRGLWIFVDEASAAELDDDTFWIHDIIGLKVATTEGRNLGEIVDVLQTGANDVYVIRTPAEVNSGKELLLPAIGTVIEEIDLANSSMSVTLPAGLIADET